MRTDQYNWEEIFHNSAVILSESLANDKKTIARPSELYAALKKYYEQNGWDYKLPKQSTYNRRMHNKLELERSQRILKTSLYKLIGQYRDMSIEALSQHLQIKEGSMSGQQCYLFLRLNRKKRSIAANKEILYSACKQLKQKFTDEILFASYDDDTIVLILQNTNAHQKIKEFVERSMVESKEE